MKLTKNVIKRIPIIMGNELIYIVSDILIKAIAFISMPFFLKVMNTEEFGQFNLYLTYSSIFEVFFGLNVANSIVRYYVEKSNDKKYLATAIWILVIGSALMSSIIVSMHFAFGFFRIDTKVLTIILINTSFSALLNIGREVVRSEKNSVLYGFSSILNSILSTLFGLILVYYMKSDLAFWRLISVCGSGMIVSGWLAIRIIHNDGIKADYDTAKYMLAYSLPLIPYTLSTNILAQVNKLFLANISLSELGIYSFASNMAMIIYIIAIALNRSLQPNLYEDLRDGNNYKKNMLKNIIIFLFFYFSFIFGSDILIWIFGNSDYLGASKIIPIIVLSYGYFFLYSLYINFLYYYKQLYMVSLFSIISAVVAIISNYFLIKPFGFTGASLATLISYFTLFVFGSVSVYKKLKIVVFSFKEIILLQIILIFPVVIKLLFI